jgi:lipopolysaccharide export system protein LptA
VRRRDRRIDFVCSATAAALLAIARAALALPEDQQQPINIHADSAELDQNKNIAIYHGSVKMEQGTMLVTGAKMTIELEDQQVVRIIAEGDRAHYEQQIKPDESKVLADAKKITYFTAEQRVELAGNAHLTQDNNEFTGELIKYNTNEGKVDASSNGQGSVQMILQPSTVKKPPAQQKPAPAKPATPAPAKPTSPTTP